MLEYLLFLSLALLGGGAMNILGLSTLWIFIPLIVIALPTIYASTTGAPYVPTDAKTAERMIALANIQPGELAVDLGCGDGRLLQAAAKAGAKTIGYELSLFLFLLARWRSLNVRYRNLWKADVSQADVVFCYLVPRAAARFAREIWPRLQPGCRVIVNAFPLPNLKPSASDGTVYRYDKM